MTHSLRDARRPRLRWSAFAGLILGLLTLGSLIKGFAPYERLDAFVFWFANLQDFFGAPDAAMAWIQPIAEQDYLIGEIQSDPNFERTARHFGSCLIMALAISTGVAVSPSIYRIVRATGKRIAVMDDRIDRLERKLVTAERTLRDRVTACDHSTSDLETRVSHVAQQIKNLPPLPHYKAHRTGKSRPADDDRHKTFEMETGNSPQVDAEPRREAHTAPQRSWRDDRDLYEDLEL